MIESLHIDFNENSPTCSTEEEIEVIPKEPQTSPIEEIENEENSIPEIQSTKNLRNPHSTDQIISDKESEVRTR